jgi:carbon-monoxide dehydrogenase large subunit
MSTGSAIGDTPRRRADQRFLTGHGATLDDLAFPSGTHAVVLCSPHAHAVIRAIDAAAARALPGVLAVLTHAEADADA